MPRAAPSRARRNSRRSPRALAQPETPELQPEPSSIHGDSSQSSSTGASSLSVEAPFTGLQHLRSLLEQSARPSTSVQRAAPALSMVVQPVASLPTDIAPAAVAPARQDSGMAGLVLSEKTRTAIKSGQYVDFDVILSKLNAVNTPVSTGSLTGGHYRGDDAVSVEINSDNTLQFVQPTRQRVRVSDLPSWLQAWTAYLQVRVEADLA